MPVPSSASFRAAAVLVGQVSEDTPDLVCAIRDQIIVVLQLEIEALNAAQPEGSRWDMQLHMNRHPEAQIVRQDDGRAVFITDAWLRKARRIESGQHLTSFQTACDVILVRHTPWRDGHNFVVECYPEIGRVAFDHDKQWDIRTLLPEQVPELVQEVVGAVLGAVRQAQGSGPRPRP